MAHGRERTKRMYAFHAQGKPYVLRLVNGPPGGIGQTRAEMDWLLYLAENGANVPCPLRTRDGALAVSVEDGGEAWVISARGMAEGRRWDKNDPALWNARVFYRWGRAVGDVHRLTKAYRPAGGRDTRGDFSIRGMIGEGVRAFPAVERVARDLLDAIEGLPRDAGAYGLIHNDLHPGNLVVDGECVHLIDFDGCARSWYAFDIGNALYLALWLGRTNDAGVDFTRDIIRCFLEGYRSANRLDDFWLSKIPLFMMACKIALFSYGCDSEAHDNASFDDKERERQGRNIESNVLFAGCVSDRSMFEQHQ